jgi:hypothetical protein
MWKYVGEPLDHPEDGSGLNGNFDYRNFFECHVGRDEHYGNVSIWKAIRHQCHWLCYDYENRSFSESGQWYHGLLTPELLTSVTVENAKPILESLDWYYAGGCYFRGRVSRRKGSIYLFP